jgi:hypothetical protein
MIKHIVTWNARGATPDRSNDANCLVKSGFEGLVGRIPGLLHLDAGVDTSGVDCARDVVLCMESASQRALDTYATHPEHMRPRNALGDIRVARRQVDYASETQ